MSTTGRERARLNLQCRGVVQGVGFRPYVHRLAASLNLRGSVRNAPGAVRIELEGNRRDLETFLSRLPRELPSAARLEACLLYTSPSPRDQRGSRMPSSA